MNKATKIAAGGLLLLMIVIGIGIGIGQTDDEPSDTETESSGYTPAPDIDQFDESDFGDDSAWDEPAYDVGYDSATDSWITPTGLAVKAPGRWQWSEDVMDVKVENVSDGTVTPYFTLKYWNASQKNLITSWDCYGESFGPGQTQRVECFGEGTYKGGSITLEDESVPY